MSSFEIERNEKVACYEMNTGEKHSGIFCAEDENLYVDLFSYEDFFFIKPENPVFLHTAKNQIVSLHENIGGPPATNTRYMEPKRVSYHQHIISNVAVIGPDKWDKLDQIKNVRFKVKHTRALLENKNLTEQLGKRDFKEALNNKLLELSTSKLNVRIEYDVSYSARIGSETAITPIIAMEFEKGASLFDYVHFVVCIVEFFSISLGALLKPSEIKICRLSSNEISEATDHRIFSGYHSVEYVWKEMDIKSSDLWVGGSPVRAWDDEELDALKITLGAWIERYEDWKKPNSLMMRCLKLNHTASTDRLLSACKWLGEIPNAKSQSAISDENIESIAEAAAKKAFELGHAGITHRIVGSLKSIKSETHDERFARLLNEIEKKFGAIVDGKIKNDLKNAMELRGKSAHGHYDPESDEEFLKFMKAIRAVEALCFLLTLKDLPIKAEGVKRLRSNPFVQDYKRG